MGFQEDQSSIQFRIYFQELKHKKIQPAYILFGKEHPAKYEFIQYLKQVGNFQRIEELSIGGSVTNEKINDFLALATAPSFWTDRYLLLITDFQNLSCDKQKRILDEVVKLPQGHFATVVIESKFDLEVQALISGYRLATLNFSDPDESTEIMQIIKMAKELGLTIDYDGALLLKELVGNNYSNIHQELVKIKTYLGTEEKITSDVILKTCGYSKESSIEDFLQALFNRSGKEALQNLEGLMYDKVHPSILVSSLANQALRLLLIKSSKTLSGYSRRFYKKLLPLSDKWRASELVWFLSELSRIDRYIKTGYTDPYLLLDTLVVRASKEYLKL
jgi:DNA polymerase III delta subunit